MRNSFPQRNNNLCLKNYLRNNFTKIYGDLAHKMLYQHILYHHMNNEIVELLNSWGYRKNASNFMIYNSLNWVKSPGGYVMTEVSYIKLN